MPQPTLYSLPFKMKETPSADGQTGGVVAGVCAVEGEVGNELGDTGILDAGAPDVTIGMLLDGVDAGLLNGIPLELDDTGVPLIELEVIIAAEDAGVEDAGVVDASVPLIELEVLVLGGAIGREEVGTEVTPVALFEALVLVDES